MPRPTVIMIHGLVGSLRYFDPQQRMPQARIITEDLLGYGAHADEAVERLTLAAQAEHVARWIDDEPGKSVWLLGHSMGGAAAVLAACLRPQRIAGIINVEGNLTEKDTFWSGKIAATSARKWAGEYERMVADPAEWLRRCGIEPDEQHVAWAEQMLANQPASTLWAMSQALLAETLDDAYLERVRRILDRGISMHLVAGEKSADGWGVPGFVRAAAASYTVQPGVGHVMMLEAPDEFCEIVESILAGRIA